MKDNSLLLLWTNADPDTAKFMVFLYVTNAKLRGWWEDVELLIWGATARLVSEDESIQERLRAAKEAGVRVVACRKCAEELGVVDKLEALDIEVFYTGEFLTNRIKDGWHTLSV